MSAEPGKNVFAKLNKMEFRTKIEVKPADHKIGYSSEILLIGSCFADNIGHKLKSFKFPVIHNPFGVLYNPASVENGLEILIEERYFTKSDLYYYKDRWISFSHYTGYSDVDPEKALNRINSSIEAGAKHLKNAGFLFITFGTAWVFEFIKTGEIVANNHKIPHSEFKRRLLEIDEIVNIFEELLNKIFLLNPHLQVIFTVSPIRHWKDGAVNNQLSKSILIVAIHKLIENYPNAAYYPAYEIFMDELRDYRYYAADMLHPAEFAIDYLWEVFTNTYISEGTFHVMKEIIPVIKAAGHRPFNLESADYKNFVEINIKRINELKAKYSFLNFDEELSFFQSKLKNVQ